MAGLEGEVAAFLAPHGKAHVAQLVAEAFRAASYPEEEWMDALIAMAPETLSELIQAVELEAEAKLGQQQQVTTREPEPEPEPEMSVAVPQQQQQQQQPPSLLLGSEGQGEAVDLLGLAGATTTTTAAQPPMVDLLGMPPPLVQGAAGGQHGYLSGSDAEGGGTGAVPPPVALPEPVFTLVCYPSELVGEKPRRVYVKALGGTLLGLKTSLQERLELEDTEFTITLDGAEPGHFVQHLADFDPEAGSYAVHIDRTVEAEAALQIRHVNEVINGQIKADMRNFLRSGFGSAWNPAMIDQAETGPEAPPFSNAKMLAAAGLAEWTKTSGWARDTGGEIDPVTGAPVRAQDGVLKDLWGEVLAEEQQRVELLAMFPDLQLSPEARDSSLSSPRSQQQEHTGAGANDAGAGEWQGVLSNLAAEISMDMGATPAARSDQQQRGSGQAGTGAEGEPRGLGSKLLGLGRKKRAELAANAEQWSKQLEDKGGLRSVVRDSSSAIGAQVQGSLKGLVTMRSFKLHIPPGEILLADATIEVVSRDGSMASLLQAIRERLGVEEAIAITMNLAVIDDIAQLPSEATVEVHRASALGWDGMAAATKSSLPTVSQAGIASTISPPASPHRAAGDQRGERERGAFPVPAGMVRSGSGSSATWTLDANASIA